MNNNDVIESTNIQLEVLEKEYMNILKQYEIATANYTENLKGEAETNSSSSYIILGVGTDGMDYVKSTWESNFVKINDDTAGDLIAISANQVDQRMIALNKGNNLVYKTHYDDPTFTLAINSCCMIDVAFGPDGKTIIGIGTDNQIYMKTDIDAPWVQKTTTDWMSAVAIHPNGQIYVLGGAYDNGSISIWRQDSYLNVVNQAWTQVGTEYIKKIAFVPDGSALIACGTDNQLYINYTFTPNVTSAWSLIPNGSGIIAVSCLKHQDISQYFKVLPGRTYWGTYGLKEGTANTQDECESMCLSDINCAGATFNPSKRYCWTRGGETKPTSGLDTDYALIPKLRQDVIILQTLNQKLLDVNKRINTKLNTLYPIAKEEVAAKNLKQQSLNQYYGALLEEQKQLELMVQEYKTIEEDLNNNTLYVNQQNSSVKFWILLALLLLVITIKQFIGLHGGTPGLIIFMISLVIIVYLTLNYT